MGGVRVRGAWGQGAAPWQHEASARLECPCAISWEHGRRSQGLVCDYGNRIQYGIHWRSARRFQSPRGAC
jgi:hypothetical protein